MADESRKASDILLSLESKIDQLIALYRSQDLVLKVLSNKFNNLIDVVGKLSNNDANLSPQKPTTDFVKISSEEQLSVEIAPKGFRRTSRPETYVLEEKPAARATQKIAPTTLVAAPSQPTIDAPVQFPEFSSKKDASNLRDSKDKNSKIETNNSPTNISFTGNKIPVEQRFVDANNKAIFLANVEIISESGDFEYKTRTNSTGKWQATLIPGKYKVKITKQESVSKEKINISQNVTIDGLSVTQTLPTLIYK